MTAAWESPVLGRVSSEPRVLAEDIAADLGLASFAVTEVVRLHLEALDSALRMDAPELLADQLRWQGVRLQSEGAGFGPAEIAQAVRRALAPHLDDAGRAAVADLQNAAAVLGESGGALTEVLVELEGPAQDYLRAALEGRRDEAIGIIRDAMLADRDAAEIMLEILQPAQIELGRLWEGGRISISHEHYTTAITQLCLSLLYPRLLLNRALVGRSLVATGVGGEGHEVGIRMVSDLMEQAGWRTTYLGADLPHDDVIEQVAQHRADVLALSATMVGHLRGVRELIDALRADPRCSGVRVLVGGRPFTVNPRLAAEVGADGWAPGPREAIELCRSWGEEKVVAG
jgi:MerR family transcriptional regulator, light-induced transcriptional regulator